MQAHSFWEELPGGNLILLFKPRVGRGIPQEQGDQGIQAAQLMLVTWGMERTQACLKQPSGTNKTQISVRNRGLDGKANRMWNVKLHSIFNQHITFYFWNLFLISMWLTFYLICIVVLYSIINRKKLVFFSCRRLSFLQKKTLQVLNTHHFMCNMQVQTLYSSTFMQVTKK